MSAWEIAGAVALGAVIAFKGYAFFRVGSLLIELGELERRRGRR